MSPVISAYLLLSAVHLVIGTLHFLETLLERKMIVIIVGSLLSCLEYLTSTGYIQILYLARCNLYCIIMYIHTVK